ncbi:MAG: zf-HC2 domain-containing protein [Candidatus Cybelea sp.]
MNQTHLSTEEIVDYLHGELLAPREAAVRAHIMSCPICERARAEEASLTEALRAHARRAERELPESVIANIRAAVAQQTPASLWDRLRLALRPAVLLPSAAAVAAALYFGFTAMHGTARATTIEPAYYIDNHAAMTATAPFSDDAPMPPMLTSENAPFADERPVDETR